MTGENELERVERQYVEVRAEAEALREALREIADTPTGCLARHSEIARAALSAKVEP